VLASSSANKNIRIAEKELDGKKKKMASAKQGEDHTSSEIKA